MRLYEAIQMRKSIRRFQMQPIEQEQMDKLNRFIKKVNPLFPDIKYRIHIIQSHQKKIFIQRGFTVKAPYYLIFYSEDTEEAAQNAGYILEQIVLYLTGKKIGTCYQGMVKIEEEHGTNTEAMKAVMTIAFGYAEEPVWRRPDCIKRDSLDKLIISGKPGNKDLKIILEAARVAPSAVNTQPWRFEIYETKICLYEKKGFSAIPLKKYIHSVDIGAALAHMMLAAEDLWLNASFCKENITLSRKAKRLHYIGTVKLLQQ